MPETITGSKPVGGTFPDQEKINKEIADKLVDQGREKAAPDPVELTAAGDALDALAKEKPDPAVPPVVEPAAPEPTAEEKAAADKKAAEEKSAADAKAAHEAKAAEIFKDSPGLPDRASPKSSEAFSAIKIKAAQEISQRDTKLEELSKQLADLQEKLKNPVPPELEKELLEHRQWRAKMDVDFDPRFKEFDKKISASHEFIYAQLKKSPAISETTIAEIRKFGGPDMVKMDKVFEAIKDPTMQRLIESKIADIEHIKYDKETAVNTAKADVDKYLKQRQEEIHGAISQHNTVTKQHLDNMVQALDWFKPREPKADSSDREAVSEHNQFVENTRKQLAEAAADDSPQMRAILLTGMVQLFNQQRVNKLLSTELETTKKSLEEVTKKWDAAKNSSVSRLHQSAASSSGNTQPRPKTDGVNTDTTGSLDALAKQILETRAAAAK